MEGLKLAIVFIPPIFLAMVLHELAHAVVALKLGDPTAKLAGRITINPIPHIDPIWTILVPALLIFSGSPIVFGGAKPVPVDTRFFKNVRRDMALVAIAGPITNFILAAVSFGLFVATAHLVTGPIAAGSPVELWVNWLSYSVMINVVLGLFNLLPVPPLDGSKILAGILPARLGNIVMELERFGFIIIIVLISLRIPQLIIAPAIQWVQRLISGV